VFEKSRTERKGNRGTAGQGAMPACFLDRQSFERGNFLWGSNEEGGKSRDVFPGGKKEKKRRRGRGEEKRKFFQKKLPITSDLSSVKKKVFVKKYVRPGGPSGKKIVPDGMEKSGGLFLLSRKLFVGRESTKRGFPKKPGGKRGKARREGYLRLPD